MIFAGGAGAFTRYWRLILPLAKPALAALAYTGQADTRVYAPIGNAGAQAGLTVNAGTTGEWPQWNPIPLLHLADRQRGQRRSHYRHQERRDRR